MTSVPPSALQIGHVEVYKGQSFELVRLDPYVRKDGRATALAVWRASCIECNQPFELTTPHEALVFKPSARRCPEHRGASLAWRHRVAETDSATAARPLPDGRPVAPIGAYDGDGRPRR